MKDIIEAAFEDRANINPQTASSEVKQAVAEAIHLLDSDDHKLFRQFLDWRS
jgi:2,3,4,5-tetrahydropyridine-2-carboxylate N-succinyltransferase